VKFHSGREFTRGRGLLAQFRPDQRALANEGGYATVKTVETPDKYTVVLKSPTVYPGIFDMLDVLYIVDKDTIEDRARPASAPGLSRRTNSFPMIAWK